MPASTMRKVRQGSAVSGALVLMLVGTAAAPAHAESVRQREWHLTAMKAEEMWQTSTGRGVTVAVIDTGVKADLADLEGRVLPGKDEASRSTGDENTDYDGHGTSMALVIAGTGRADGGHGTFGLAPGAKILPVRMPDLGMDAPRHNDEFVGALSRGIRYAADSGAQVINISMGGLKGSKQLTAAVTYALGRGSLIFAGTGNDGDSSAAYPAATPGVVAVGAVGRNLKRTSESQYGPQVEMAAPGEEIYHTCPNGIGLCRSHGTSDATALASASAALIWSKHPTWTNNQVLRVMLDTAGGPTDGSKRNDSIGYGIVRPRIALQNPGNPGSADKYPLPDFATETPASSSASTSASRGTSAAARDDNSATGASSKGSGGSVLWTALGITAVVLLGGAIAVVAGVRRRPAVRIDGQPAHRD
ncbi:type VII secretion-associated serine protease mycosin [Streptomyces sp. NPDC057950]|uniref:type VII secretion-associated serine protease mycosin n=1 Tax=Streptomyces sp. NPDC057950 TaxID=3346288 RepID=UPI0036E809FB